MIINCKEFWCLKPIEEDDIWIHNTKGELCKDHRTDNNEDNYTILTRNEYEELNNE